MKIGNDKDVNGGATVWTCPKIPDEGYQLRKWTATPYEDLVRLEPAGRGGGVIFLKPAEVFATADEAREDRAKRLEGELEQVRGLEIPK